jgi:hypothetical protein
MDITLWAPLLVAFVQLNANLTTSAHQNHNHLKY